MYIPKLMCTQHPDSTVKITASEEVDEAVISHLAYGCDEYMVDYEGKATPYSQPRDIVAKAAELDIPLGNGFYITPRIPNPNLEDFERSMLAIEASVLANSYSQRAVGADAVKWIILPMVEDYDTMALVYRAIDLKVRSLGELERVRGEMEIQLVPLIEDAVKQLNIKSYIRSLFRVAANSGHMYEDMRIFLGISDSAIRHGHIASSLAMVKALGDIAEINREGEYRVWPIVGMGSPPFRGGLNNPKLAGLEASQYGGYHTVTIQSAVRYDVSFSEYLSVKNSLLNSYEARNAEIDPGLVEEASKVYRDAISRYLSIVTQYASYIPSTRDRFNWRLYGRLVGDAQIPRAITFTATWYYIGVPPVLLDAPVIKWAYSRGLLDSILKALPALRAEWEYDISYYSPRRAAKIVGEELVRLIGEAMDILGISGKPDPLYHKLLESADSQAHALALSRMRGFLG